MGHFDHQRVQAYLKKISQSVDSYEGIDIFNVPVEDRTVRVAILSIDTVAISNVPDPERHPRHDRPLPAPGAAGSRAVAAGAVLSRRAFREPGLGDCQDSLGSRRCARFQSIILCREDLTCSCLMTAR